MKCKPKKMRKNERKYMKEKTTAENKSHVEK